MTEEVTMEAIEAAINDIRKCQHYWLPESIEVLIAAASQARLIENQEAAPSDSGQGMGSFWVIERFENGRSAGYWDGGSSRNFVPNIDDAVQFCRHNDAFWATRGWHWKDTKITEHKMLASAPAPSPDNGWPEAIREAAAQVAEAAKTKESVTWDGACEGIATAIRAMPLPPPPAQEGGKL